jgi:hypothetical protein
MSTLQSAPHAERYGVSYELAYETFVTTYRKEKKKKKLKKIIMTKVKPLLPQCCSCSHSFWKARLDGKTKDLQLDEE